ncbi:hypothetical protein GCM10023093_00840 [Nemorincola caseinilytica]|uniref:SMODS and SLOG-associating 2TM effector domain-containing protein n=1 Tax=Nemorincola caseinilytica TaxID=2054315 RepID=A0ABP8N417_9BACT
MPTLTINIGITGRTGAPSAGIDINEELGNIFSLVGQCVTMMFANGLNRYYAGSPHHYLLTTLASHYDRIASQIALDKGFALQCAIPSKKERYAQSLASDEKEREVISSLLSKCERLFELDLEDTMGSKWAGEIVVDHCDVLIAICDGRNTGDDPGSQHMIELANAQNVPVLYVDAATAKPAVLSFQGQQVPLSGDALIGVLQPLLSPGDGAAFNDMYNKEPAPYWRYSFIDPMLKHLFTKGFQGRPALGRSRYDIYAKQGWEELWQGAVPGKEDLFRDYADGGFREKYEQLDALSMRYADTYKSAGIMRHIYFFLSGMGLCIGFYYGFWYNSAGEKTLTVTTIRTLGFVMQAICILLIRRIYKNNEAARWHQRYIDYRILAEMLRHSTLLTSMGIGVHGISLPAFLKKDGVSWINWHFRVIMRNAGIPAITVNALQLDTTKLLIGNLLNGQVRYHTDSERKNNLIARRLKSASDLFSRLTYTAVLVRVGVYALNVLNCAALMNEDLLDILVKTTNALCLLFPALMLLFDSIAAQGGYDMLAQRSAAMKNGAAKLKEMADAKADHNTLKQVIQNAATLMIAEVSDWRLFVNTKTIKK